MRVQPLLLRSLVLMSGVTLASCAGADDPPRVTSNCDTGTGSTCTLTLDEAGGYTITMTSRSCDAINNTVRLVSPVVETLTEDACRVAVGTVWDNSTPSNPAGTQIGIEFESDQFANPPGLRVTGAYPTWTVSFEDGFDLDFNDIVLSVVAVPAT
jgi:hypothetical protein